MKILYITILVFLIVVPVKAAEECIFDQKAQDETLLKLQKIYTGSKVNLSHKTLELQWEGGTITYQRGGCFHFGETVTYSTTNGTNFSTKAELFKQTVKMTKEFFRDFVSGSEIERALQNGKYKYKKLSQGDYYSIPNDNESIISLGILHAREGQKHVIEVGYYVN